MVVFRGLVNQFKVDIYIEIGLFIFQGRVINSELKVYLRISQYI